ncbi:MAG: hypothetical protein ACYTEG_14715, partial [Planctomycetota bacterium]
GRYFPAPYQGSNPEKEGKDVYKPLVDWFAGGKTAAVNDETAELELNQVPGLLDLVQAHLPEDHTLGAELVLEGLHRSSLLAKERSEDGVVYSDMLKDMFRGM